MLRYFSLGLLSLALLISTASAQTQTLLPTDNATWQIHANVKTLFASPLGGIINDIVNKEAPDGKLHIDALVKALGFDPRTAVGDVVVFGEDFEHTSVTALANIGASRGNLEGWLLPLPGYQSEELDAKTLLHSFLIQNDKHRHHHGHSEDVPTEEGSHEESETIGRLWCAIPQSQADKNYIFVASFDREMTVALAKQVRAEGTDSLGELAENTFLSLRVNDLSQAPIEIDEDEPGSALIKTIQSLSLSAAGEEDNLNIIGEIAADSPARAQQINQLLVGMKAMVQLALPEKHPEKKHFADVLNNLNVEYAEGASTLSANFSIGYDVIQEMIEAKHGHGHR